MFRSVPITFEDGSDGVKSGREKLEEDGRTIMQTDFQESFLPYTDTRLDLTHFIINFACPHVRSRIHDPSLLLIGCIFDDASCRTIVQGKRLGNGRDDNASLKHPHPTSRSRRTDRDVMLFVFRHVDV